jgi:predicted ArsR family transcriptional regulator
MMGEWTVFSNHGHVLVCLANNNEARLRDVAEQVGITERAVQKIVHELQQGGLITISKRGRCNRYDINTRKNLRHPLQAQCTVGGLLKALADSSGSRRKPAATSAQTAEPAQEAAVVTELPQKAKAPVKTATAPAPAPTLQTAPTASTHDDATKKPAEKRGKKMDTREQGSLF